MRAGIQQGDVLTAFGDRKIRYYNDYISALMQAEPDSTIELTIMRPAQGEYKEMNIKITLDKR
jgi:serine protease Do